MPVEHHLAHAVASGECLRQIPGKAQEMLGIGYHDATSIWLNDYALKEKATAVHASVAVIGQKLIVALRAAIPTSDSRDSDSDSRPWESIHRLPNRLFRHRNSVYPTILASNQCLRHYNASTISSLSLLRSCVTNLRAWEKTLLTSTDIAGTERVLKAHWRRLGNGDYIHHSKTLCSDQLVYLT